MFKLLGKVTKQPIDGLTYAVALRAIGQDLADLLIQSLEITVQGDDVFIAQGYRIARAEPFERSYTLADLIRLDERGAARQTDDPKTPDASTLAEALRTVGRAVDNKQGRLVKLAKDQRKIKFEYEDENGRVRKEEFHSLLVYQGQQEGLSLRSGKERADVWKNSRG
ncbi:MAG TPA: hypothetical protein VGL11_20830 [Candidatus Binatia bacterium]|jgi:hypothetical protein